jgi:predicted nucleotidyltransferase
VLPPVRGVDADGYLTREGSLARVPTEFRPLVADARERVTDLFGPQRLHSAYLYGSIPRGTAVPGRSDLDLLLALHHEPTAADRTDVRRLETELDARFPQIDGVGTLLFSTARLLSATETHDLGWVLACLCTPLCGPDLAERLPRHRPTSRLARESNGDLPAFLERMRGRRAAAGTDLERARVCRVAARKIVRCGMSLVMPRWGGWTSDLAESAEVFGAYYPDRAGQMRRAAEAARQPTPAPQVLDLLLDGLGEWLAAEYTAVHGQKMENPPSRSSSRSPT